MNSRLLQVQDWEKLARQAWFRPSVMAALCTISLRQLQRFFAEHFQETPRAWASRVRCRLAARLLSEGWSNKAVVEELRFGNAAHLCHEFKRVYRVTPQAFAPVYAKKCATFVAVARASVANNPRIAQIPAAAIIAHAATSTNANHVAFRQQCRV
jgi:AraC-like DNA-binding protein